MTLKVTNFYESVFLIVKTYNERESLMVVQHNFPSIEGRSLA